MLRPNRLGCLNSSLQYNQIDEQIKKIGGTIYTNCFTPAPDTPRSMASFYTGLYPFQNGCTTRVKWPAKFLNPNVETIFDSFIENNFKITCFSNPNERKTGLFPQGMNLYAEHNDNFDLKGYLSDIQLKKDHLVFISIPDYHWSLQDWSYSSKGESEAIIETSYSIDLIFDSLNKDDFDHIFLFSDHGFKFSMERRTEPQFEFINRDRTNIFLLHREKGQTELTFNDKFSSIKDIKTSVDSMFNKEGRYSLLSGEERDYIIIEDHYSTLAPTVNQNLDLWGVVQKEQIYIRTLQGAISLNWDNKIISEDVSEELDSLLIDSSQFGVYLNEYNKVFAYKSLLMKQTLHMNGRPRLNVKKNYLKILYYIFLDYLKKF